MKETGKVLCVKMGYNPNSSSIGSHIPTFFALATGIGLMSMIVLNQLKVTAQSIKNKKDELEPVQKEKAD